MIMVKLKDIDGRTVAFNREYISSIEEVDKNTTTVKMTNGEKLIFNYSISELMSTIDWQTRGIKQYKSISPKMDNM